MPVRRSCGTRSKPGVVPSSTWTWPRAGRTNAWWSGFPGRAARSPWQAISKNRSASRASRPGCCGSSYRRADFADPERLAQAIKDLPIPLLAARPLEEAISSAGGVKFEALDEHLMIRALPGVFCAGEMLDWEAPTGGYLLTACFASGRVAGLGALEWMKKKGQGQRSKVESRRSKGKRPTREEGKP